MVKMIKLNDRGETRVKIESITSYSKDYDLLPPSGKVDTIILTIGSALRKISYQSTELRDKDFNRLEELLDVGNNLR